MLNVDQPEGSSTGSVESQDSVNDRPRRVAISKGLRFKIFHRDHFQCVYCGRTPPAVLLEVDHVIPVAGGGTNDEANLVTACEDCNAGKRDKSLKEIPRGHAETLAERQEKLEQLRGISELMIEERKTEDESVDLLSDHWMRLAGDDPAEWRVSTKFEQSMRRFLRQLPIAEVMDAIDITFSNIPNKSEYVKCKYFCGVCWTKIREKRSLSAPEIGQPVGK